LRRGIATLKPINRFCFLAGLLAFSLISIKNVFAEQNVGGFAWSENIGWVSFNNATVDGVSGGGGARDYGVSIDEPTGLISGYAWSENLGWISFNQGDLAGCPSGVCEARVDTELSGGKYLISGWARALSAKNEPGNNGGWDGWIKLKGPTYGWYIDETGNFHNYAFGSTNSGDPATQGVVGWISANCAEGKSNGGSVCGQSNYKVHTSAQFGPTAAIGCDASQCPGGLCGSIWVVYQPTACSPCTLTAKNNSTGNVGCTKWELVGTSYKYASSGKQDHTFQTGVPAGTYTLKLTVSDRPYNNGNNPDCTAGHSDSATQQVQVRREAQADFMCSFIDPNATPTPENPTPPPPEWMDCAGADYNAFKNKAVKDQPVYLRDSASLSVHSLASEGATQISARNWRFTVDGAETTASGADVNFILGKENTIRLDITDNASRSDCKITTVKAKKLPKWQESSPVGMIKSFGASLSQLFAALR